jgi:hypothetical protein
VRPDVERAETLRDVLHHVAEVSKTAPSPRQVAWRRHMLATVCLLLLALSTYSWLARPAFIWGPGTRMLPREHEDAGARFSMMEVAQRIELYRRDHGRIPESLEAVDASGRGISYAAINDSMYELRALSGSTELIFRSTDSVEAFLSSSVSYLTGARRP